MKQLAGTWTSTTIKEGKEQTMTVNYKISSAGSTLVETMFPGMPHEMVTVYHDAGNTLQLTHYCAMGNQPTLALKEHQGNTLFFDFIGGANIDAGRDGHMHSLKVTLVDEDTLVQHWSNYENGKQAGINTFNWKRVK